MLSIKNDQTSYVSRASKALMYLLFLYCDMKNLFGEEMIFKESIFRLVCLEMFRVWFLNSSQELEIVLIRNVLI